MFAEKISIGEGLRCGRVRMTVVMGMKILSGRGRLFVRIFDSWESVTMRCTPIGEALMNGCLSRYFINVSVGLCYISGQTT